MVTTEEPRWGFQSSTNNIHASIRIHAIQYKLQNNQNKNVRQIGNTHSCKKKSNWINHTLSPGLRTLRQTHYKFSELFVDS